MPTGGYRTGGVATVEPPNSDIARQALRRLASGVTVLTINQNGVRHGTTVSAVNTMSRDPLVLGACLSTSSSFGAMVWDVRLFSVNVLAVEQEFLAGKFADPERPMGDAQFENLQWTDDPLTGAPLIGGCVAHMACRATDRHRVGDHDLIVAEVVDGAPGAGVPLLTFAGRLHRPALAELSRQRPAAPPAHVDRQRRPASARVDPPQPKG
jgi:flavin reductase (DIM6/NTAB) family NADH-FMN oxidoreductase RutF